MSVGTAFYPRAAPLNRKQQWREWSGLLRSERVPRLPRDRVQRHPRGGRAHRRLSALQVPRLRPGRDTPRRPRDHPGREQARRRPRLLHVLVQRGRPRRRRRDRRPPGRADLSLDGRRPVAALVPPERSRARRRDRGRERTGRRAGGAGPVEPRRARRGHRDGVGRPQILRPAGCEGGQRLRRRLPYGLHRRPRLRGVGGERACARGLGRLHAPRDGPTARGRPGCLRSTSPASRPG